MTGCRKSTGPKAPYRRHFRAFQFDDQVYRYFTEYVLNQDPDRLQWGAGRIVHHVDLSAQVRSLKEKLKTGDTDTGEEEQSLRRMEAHELACFDDDIRYLIQAMDTLICEMKKAKGV